MFSIVSNVPSNGSQLLSENEWHGMEISAQIREWRGTD